MAPPAPVVTAAADVPTGVAALASAGRRQPHPGDPPPPPLTAVVHPSRLPRLQAVAPPRLPDSFAASEPTTGILSSLVFSRTSSATPSSDPSSIARSYLAQPFRPAVDGDHVASLLGCHHSIFSSSTPTPVSSSCGISFGNRHSRSAEAHQGGVEGKIRNERRRQPCARQRLLVLPLQGGLLIPHPPLPSSHLLFQQQVRLAPPFLGK